MSITLYFQNGGAGGSYVLLSQPVEHRSVQRTGRGKSLHRQGDGDSCVWDSVPLNDVVSSG